MPKAKLKIEAAKKEAFVKAANFCDVNIEETEKFGTVDLTLVSFKQPSQLFELGEMTAQLNNTKKAQTTA